MTNLDGVGAASGCGTYDVFMLKKIGTHTASLATKSSELRRFTNRILLFLKP